MSRMDIAAHHGPGLQVAVKVALFEVQNDEIITGGGLLLAGTMMLTVGTLFARDFDIL